MQNDIEFYVTMVIKCQTCDGTGDLSGTKCFDCDGDGCTVENIELVDALTRLNIMARLDATERTAARVAKALAYYTHNI